MRLVKLEFFKVSKSTFSYLGTAFNKFSSFRTPSGTPGPECCLAPSLRPVDLLAVMLPLDRRFYCWE